MPDLSVVIPVYNEEENLGPLWIELREVLEIAEDLGGDLIRG